MAHIAVDHIAVDNRISMDFDVQEISLVGCEATISLVFWSIVYAINQRVESADTLFPAEVG